MRTHREEKDARSQSVQQERFCRLQDGPCEEEEGAPWQQLRKKMCS